MSFDPQQVNAYVVYLKSQGDNAASRVLYRDINSLEYDSGDGTIALFREGDQSHTPSVILNLSEVVRVEKYPNDVRVSELP